MFTIRRLTAKDLPRLNQFWIRHWGGTEMIVHGDVFQAVQLDGFVAEQNDNWIGLVTFYINGTACEIMSLDSLQEDQGIGTNLVEEVILKAREAGCQRIFLTTTNDNLRALGFYQQRGFELACIRRGAVNESRRIKPSIPLTGCHNIPIRDEMELELELSL
jgi:N-acetylglutamate synthase-like GNAT family acetyltransferase